LIKLKVAVDKFAANKMKLSLKAYKNFDWLLFFAVIFLFVLGLAVIFSSTFQTEAQYQSNAINQLVYGGVGLLIFVLFAFLDYRLFKNYSAVIYIILVGILILVAVFGKTVFGATRWIDLGFFQLQPSEISKLLLIIALAKYFAQHAAEMDQLKHIVKSGIYMGIPLILVALQPDLGTALTFFVIWLMMLLVSNARKIHLFFIGIFGALATPVFWQLLKDYQKSRILVFLNPQSDPTGAGWNITQALIAIGSGRFWGRGLGHGPQSQLNFLPAKHTDFIFAVLAEEMGFLGALILIIFFFILLFRILRASKLARDNFGMFLCVGIFAMIFFHVFVNIGMNIGIMPVTGIPLPFISYGGTAIVVSFAAMGLVESVIRRHKTIEF